MAIALSSENLRKRYQKCFLHYLRNVYLLDTYGGCRPTEVLKKNMMNDNQQHQAGESSLQQKWKEASVSLDRYYFHCSLTTFGLFPHKQKLQNCISCSSTLLKVVLLLTIEINHGWRFLKEITWCEVCCEFTHAFFLKVCG